MASWHGRDLASVLEELRREAAHVMRCKPPGVLAPVRPDGNSEADVRAHEQRLGRPIPAPIRELYRNVDGIAWNGETIHTGLTLLVTLDETSWVDPQDHSILDDLDPKWIRNDYFAFAGSMGGDLIVFCDEPPGHPPGSIILLDHECLNCVPDPDIPGTYTPIVFLGDNLAEWIARWMACGFDEFAVVPDTVYECPREVECDFLLDHIRLNPRARWAEQRLQALRCSGQRE